MRHNNKCYVIGLLAWLHHITSPSSSSENKGCNGWSFFRFSSERFLWDETGLFYFFHPIYSRIPHTRAAWMRLDRPNDLSNFQGLLEDEGGLLTGFFELYLIYSSLILQGLTWNYRCCSGHLKTLAVLTHIEAVFFFQPRMFCYLSQQGT